MEEQHTQKTQSAALSGAEGGLTDEGVLLPGGWRENRRNVKCINLGRHADKGTSWAGPKEVEREHGETRAKSESLESSSFISV